MSPSNKSEDEQDDVRAVQADTLQQYVAFKLFVVRLAGDEKGLSIISSIWIITVQNLGEPLI